MAHGILLTIYQPTAAVIADVSQLLHNAAFPFEVRESTFFIQVGFTAAFDDLVAALRTAGITFSAVLLFDTTGSALRTGNISSAETQQLNQLLTMP